MTNEPIYKVVNKDNNTSIPNIFINFIDAFKAAEKWSDRAVVECYHGEFVEEVWSPEYNEYNCEVV